MKEKPSYFSILTADVRYDKSLSDKAKLLYSEITALAQKDGYCWASNKYFAELYGVHEVTISKLISQLASKGYVQVEIDRKAGNSRKVYVGILGKNAKTPISKNAKTPISKNAKTPISENAKTPISENAKIIIQDNNTTSINKSKKERKKETHAGVCVPSGGVCVRDSYDSIISDFVWNTLAQEDDSPDRLQELETAIKSYLPILTQDKKLLTNYALTELLQSLAEQANDIKDFIAIVKHSIAKRYDKFYPLSKKQ